MAERLDLGHTEATAEKSAEPFDIKDYQATLVEASDVIQRMDSLIKTIEHVIDSPGFKQLEPILTNRSIELKKKAKKS